VVTGGLGTAKSATLMTWLARREAAGTAVPHRFIHCGPVDPLAVSNSARVRRDAWLESAVSQLRPKAAAQTEALTCIASAAAGLDVAVRGFLGAG
jgi:hypothetical protein